MKDILTLAFVSFAPLYYFFQLDFAYDKGTNQKEKTFFAIVTVLTTATFFAKLLSNQVNDYVYYLLVGSIAGPFIDVMMGVYPNTGNLCQTISIALFVLGEKFDNQNVFGWIGIALILLSIAAYTSVPSKKQVEVSIVKKYGMF